MIGSPWNTDGCWDGIEFKPSPLGWAKESRAVGPLMRRLTNFAFQQKLRKILIIPLKVKRGAPSRSGKISLLEPRDADYLQSSNTPV